MDDATAMKVCRTCGLVKSEGEFSRHSAGRRRPDCNACRTERRRAWATMSPIERQADREARREARRLEHKVCSKCGKDKDAAEFHRRTDRAGGLLSKCKECAKKDAAAYHERNRERKNGASRAWRKANPAKWKASYTRHRLEHVDEIRARRRAAYDPIGQAAKNKAFNLANPSYRTEYRRANPEKFAAASARRRAAKLASQLGPIDADTLWTGLCGICGYAIDVDLRAPDPMSKSLDHIVPLSRGGSHTQENLQWTHLVCNQRKGARLPDTSGQDADQDQGPKH